MHIYRYNHVIRNVSASLTAAHTKRWFTEKEITSLQKVIRKASAKLVLLAPVE